MNSYKGIYFSNSYFSSNIAFNSAFLFYDEVSIISPMDIQTDPNEYYKNFKVPYKIGLIGQEDDDCRKKIDLLVKTIDFAVRNKILIGNGLVYKDHILNTKINSLVNTLMSGKGIPVDELIKFAYGKDDVGEAFDEIKKYLKQSEEHQLKIKASAYLLSKKENYELIDDGDDKIPIFDSENRKVKQLSGILSENCFTILMPRVEEIGNPEQLLEIKEYLKDILVPYRMALQKLSKKLKDSIKSDNCSYSDLGNEARFIVESEVEPYLYEMKMKIEQSENKMLIKTFGKILGWIPLIATLYYAPSPDKLLAAFSKAYNDIGSMGESIYNTSLARDLGFSYIISVNKKVEKVIKKEL